MKIQKGMVKYKDRNDIICMYGVTDAGKTYYFLDSSEDKAFSNGNRVASTELVEAIDSMVKASNIGVVDSLGNEVIACENKGIKTIYEDVLLVEKAVPTTASVLEAINNRNNSLHAAQLVSTPAQIKDNIYKEMGNDGRFLFNDQFSEATICDINGNNLVNGEVYSFVAINNGTLYLSKNVPDSPVEHLLLNNKVEEQVSDEATNAVADEIDVSTVNVSIDDVEKALESQDLAPGNNVIQDNFDTDISTPLDNVNEGLSIPSSDDFLAATNLGAGLPVVEEDNVSNENETESVGNDIANENETETVGNEVVADENEFVNMDKSLDEVANDEVAPIDEVTKEVEEEIMSDEAVNASEITNEETVDAPVAQTEEVAPSVDELPVVEDTTVDDEVAPIDDVVVTEEVSEDNNELNSVEVESVKENDEFTTVEANDEEMVENTIQEDIAPVEEVVAKEEDALVQTEEPESFNFSEEDTNTDVFSSNVEVERDNDDLVSSTEERDTILNESDIQSLFDRTSLDLFNGGPLQIDSIVSDVDDFDSYSINVHETSNSENLFEDLAKSMTGLIKQNREQRATIANYEAVIKGLHNSKNELKAKVTETEHQNVELCDRNRTLENAVIKLKTRIEILASKLKERDEKISMQAAEIERLKPQLEGRNQLLGLLKDAQSLIGDDQGLDDIEEYGYSKVA